MLIVFLLEDKVGNTRTFKQNYFRKWDNTHSDLIYLGPVLVLDKIYNLAIISLHLKIVMSMCTFI